MVTPEKVWEALQRVADPEYPLSIVDLGMVYSVAVEGGQVQVEMTFTSIGCPAIDWIICDMKEAILSIPGARSVKVDVVWSPAWSKEKITPQGREILRYHGVV